MQYDILGIGPLSIRPALITNLLPDDAEFEFRYTHTDSLAEAEEFFFNAKLCLLIAHSQVPGLREHLTAMKNDEMFRFIPVIVVMPEGDHADKRSLLSYELTNVVPEPAVDTLLYPLVPPLVKTFLFIDNLMNEVSELHEKAIRDFILVDLIKDYIPKTIWNLAKDYAHLQKISIPEEETELTLVFADIKGFSSLTQHLSPREVITTLNTVFDVATRIVHESGGDIDKFIGDAFFAVYTDPAAAVESMVRLQRELKSLNKQRALNKKPPIMFRVGIHTGPVIRGNVGGNHRFDNTLIGDTVNIASRLEHIAPPGGIIASQETLTKAGITIPERFRRREKLRGRDTEDIVYEIFTHLQ